MSKFESNVQYTKYLVNKEVTKRFLAGENLNEAINDIAETIIPGPKPITRCCIYKERHIIGDRARLVIEPIKEGENVIKIIRSACDECPVDRFTVTEACRGCLAHKCHDVCPKGAITIVNHRAYINHEICIECGKCHDVCPFGAISDVLRPCLCSCEAKAIVINEEAYVS